MQKPDSLIFDMDGTLWDAVDTYAQSWNLIFQKLDIQRIIKRDELLHVIGMDGKKLTRVLLPEFDEAKGMEIYNAVNQIRREILPTSGGMMYNGVTEGLKQLANKYKLFVLSNCAVGIIPLFLTWAGINEVITDSFAYGTNQMPKSHNMHLLMDKHNLKSPVYIGDTNGDAEQTRIAGIPFAFVSYGFGNTDDYDVKFDDFESLTQYYLSL
ncbi:phosphoglycolate phosphatase [Mucilaginibacter gossypiicola]|uniref:phosphoglycolate phosphatase n=1 Tax=Mucilaginibacter gossypiicola TaxID=551995 RepID=A0A1H7ZL07_9SPHI|nr:HAD family hydrolase [Mucilaginibacter gossypiicola]SEM58943.1 phosphoglycolate phosphatase [Mucilaginibacter gossypiicola]